MHAAALCMVSPLSDNVGARLVPAVHAGDEVHFKVKPTTKFEKIFNAWKTRKAVQTGVRFVVDGVQLHEHRTPGEH